MGRNAWPALELHFPPSQDDSFALPDRVSAALVDIDCLGIVETSESEWCISFRDRTERDRLQQLLHRQLAGSGLTLRAIDVADKDWAARSQRHLQAVSVGRIVVAPPWDRPSTERADTIVVTIVPSTGFGTGHHASTRLCLLALQAPPVVGRDILDVGTGSGVLAIAATLLGARRVVGIDLDPDVLTSAQENIVLNGVSDVVALRHEDFRHSSVEAADIVLANLTGGLLVNAAASLVNLVNRDGYLIVSGLARSEEEDVSSAFSVRGVTLVERHVEDQWVALTWRRE